MTTTPCSVTLRPARESVLVREHVLTRTLAPALLAAGALLLPGCYLDHGADRRSDAGAQLDAALGPIDAGAPLLDAPSSCVTGPAPRPDFACFEGTTQLVADQPFTMEIGWEDGYCDPTLRCEVVADPGTRSIRVSTVICETAGGDRCDRPTLTCTGPPLTAGSWSLVVHGEHAAQLWVAPADAPVEAPPGPGCITFAEPDRCEGPLPVQSVPPATALCVVPRPDGQFWVRLEDDCGGCFLQGECTVHVAPTPRGASFDVHAERSPSRCGEACPDICMPNTFWCRMPTVPPEGEHHVQLDGAGVMTFPGGIVRERCISVFDGAPPPRMD